MPYNPDDVSGLPSNVQKMDDKSRRQWCHVFDSAITKHGDEGLAFREANGVLKKEGKQPGDKEIGEKISKELGLKVEVKGRIGAEIEEEMEVDDALEEWLKKSE